MSQSEDFSLITVRCPLSAEKPRLVIIQGPTASGKSELAVRLAERLGGEIVNADSMQVYRRMDVGTAKPSPELLARVPHHLLDICDPNEDFSAADFRERAARAIEEIHRRLAEVDPAAALRLHPNDRVRIVRALEVFLMTGKSLTAFHEEHRFAEEGYDCLRLGIAVERELLYRRIDERVDRMIAKGLVEEVRGLLEAGYSPSLKAMGAIGYREICAHLSGEVSIEEATRLIKQNTRNYAKRQMTWFRKESEIIWVDYPDKFDSICTNVMVFYN